MYMSGCVAICHVYMITNINIERSSGICDQPDMGLNG